MSRIVLAYSGSLDSSVAIPWLADRHAAEIIAVTVDLGQGKEVLEEIRDRALATGALRAHVIDARDLYLRDHILRGLRAGMLWHGGGSMARALAIPVVAEKLVEIARIEQASIAAHADPRGSAAPIDRILRAIDPRLDVKTPAADWAMSRDEQVEYARCRGIALPAEMIGGVAVRAAGAAPREPALVDVAFVRGVPVGINGVMMPLGDLIASLDILAAAHGVALASLGMLHLAHAALRRTALAAPAEAFSTRVADQYVAVLADGAWFTPLRHALDAYVDAIEQEVAGKVRLKLFQGECTVDECTRAMQRVPLSMASVDGA
jgi:argininosuccinate synthase